MRPVVAPVLLVWLGFALPFVAAGPDDLEEFFTGVATTKIAVEALASGAAPFWTSTMALGLPQPLRFHFISHPLATACTSVDCGTVLRMITALHVLVGAFAVASLVHRLSSSRGAALAAAITWLGCSSTIQPTYVDDWPITGINEASLPVLCLAALNLLHAEPRRAALPALVLAGLAGLLLSMSLPLVVCLATAAIVIAEPARLRARLGWFTAAGALTLIIGGGQLYHLIEQVNAAPLHAVRDDHPDPALALTLWSTFLRPFVAGPEESWRTVFLGPVFAVSATLVSVAARDARLRPFHLGLLLSVLGLVLPERVLFDIITTRWAFRTGVNLFGIVLGAWGLHWLWARGGASRVMACLAGAIHFISIAVAVFPAWRPVQIAAVSPHTGERRLAPGPLAGAIQDLDARDPGRWMIAERAYTALRELRLAREGLAPNQLPMLGVRTLNVVAYGLSIDSLYPAERLLIGGTPPSAAAVRSAAFLDALGIRYVLAAAGDAVAPGLTEIARLPGDLRVFRNDGAWPDAFFVERLPTAAVPRLPGCAHDRFLCADFSRYDLRRQDDALQIERRADAITLRFEAADRERYIVVTEWFQPGWRVASGGARVSAAAEQLIGVAVDPGETDIRLRYWPSVRAPLFFLGLFTEAAVLVACGALLLVRVRRRRSAHG